jgi:hypothetical protein
VDKGIIGRGIFKRRIFLFFLLCLFLLFFSLLLCKTLAFFLLLCLDTLLFEDVVFFDVFGILFFDDICC